MAEAPGEAFDAVVIGGGPVGAAIALGLGESGRRVALVERQRPQAQMGALGMDLRTVALSPGSRQLLQRLGVWPRLRPAPYNAMHVWEERGTASLRFEAAEVGRGELGWIQESSPLAEAAWQQLSQQPNIDLIVGNWPLRVATGAKAVTATLGERRLSAALLVAADGANSAVRGQLGVRASIRDTGQVALATVARGSVGHGGVAWQRFLLDGPLALLPGADGQTVAVVWSQSPASAKRRMALGDAEFCAELTHASEACIGETLAVDQRLCFPLSQAVAASFNPHPRVLLVGDAARLVHPLAGLGLNLGLEDAASLLRTASGALDLGTPGLWRVFARRRRARALAMVRILAALQGFYGLPQPTAQWLRNFGVRLVNGAAPIKRQLVQEALGLGPVARRLA